MQVLNLLRIDASVTRAPQGYSHFFTIHGAFKVPFVTRPSLSIYLSPS